MEIQKDKLIEIAKEQELFVLTRTAVKLNKKDKEGNPNDLPPLWKYQLNRVTVNESYQQAVNEQRVVENKEADFEAGKRSWNGVQTNAVIDREGVLYLSVILKEVVGDATYANDRFKIFEKSEFIKFMPASSPAKGQQLDNEVKARTYKFESIVGVWDNIEEAKHFVEV